MMIESIAERISPVLNFSIIRQIRRNHGLEHATVHILSQRIRNLRIAGRSSHDGFVLFGDVPTESVEQAVDDALRRMKNGEHSLAVHPNCGTNLATTGIMTSLVGLFGFGIGSPRSRFSPNRFSWVMLFMIGAIVYSQPIGMKLQRFITTEGDLDNMEIVGVVHREIKFPFNKGKIVMHQVITREGSH